MQTQLTHWLRQPNPFNRTHKITNSYPECVIIDSNLILYKSALYGTPVEGNQLAPEIKLETVKFTASVALII